MRQRTAVVATRIYQPEGGAAAFRLAALVKQLEQAGYQTTVLTSTVPQRVRSTKSVRRWPVLRDKTGAVRGYLQYASFDIPLFFRLLFIHRPDIVIVEPPPTTGIVCRVVCGMRKIPYAYFSADVSSTAAAGIGVNRWMVRIIRSIESWVLRGARLVFAVSQGVASEVVALGAHQPWVIMVGTGIDTETFSLAGPSRPSGSPYFVYAGTMSEIQGAGVFVHAFARIAPRWPQARLIMLGGGVEHDELMRFAATQACADRIEFRGTVTGAEVAEWLRGATAGLASVRPGRGYDFAYATKALVSIACGSPVVYAGVGPIGEQVASQRLGWTVDWDEEAVADAMVNALSTEISAAERKRLAAWADANASLRTVGQRAVSAIDSALSPG